MTVAMAVEAMPMKSEMRAPEASRLSSSRKSRSVPSQNVAFGPTGSFSGEMPRTKSLA